MNESRPEECLEPASGRVEILRAISPYGHVERDIEEPFRTVSDPVLKLNGIVQCCAPPGIGAATAVVDDSERR